MTRPRRASAPCGRVRCRLRRPPGLALGCAAAPPQAEHPVAVVVEVAVERGDASVRDQPQLVGGRAQQVAVVRDDDQRAVVILQRFGQRLAHLDVEVVGRLVEDQQVRLLPHEQREREARLFAAGKAADRRARHVAAKIEPAEKIAQLLLARTRLDLREMPQRRLLDAQLLDLMLREVADLQRLRGQPLARSRRERSGHRFQQRRLAGAVRPEQADALAGEDRPRDAGEDRRIVRRIAIAQRDAFEAHELPGRDRRRRKA